MAARCGGHAESTGVQVHDDKEIIFRLRRNEKRYPGAFERVKRMAASPTATSPVNDEVSTPMEAEASNGGAGQPSSLTVPGRGGQQVSATPPDPHDISTRAAMIRTNRHEAGAAPPTDDGCSWPLMHVNSLSVPPHECPLSACLGCCV